MALDLETQDAEEIFVMRTFMLCSSPYIIRIEDLHVLFITKHY